MRILIAEDDPVSRHVLTTNLLNWGHDVVIAVNGLEAWRASQEDDAPRLAILDWMMPEMEGPEVVAECENRRQPFLLILFCLRHVRQQKKSLRECRQALMTI